MMTVTEILALFWSYVTVGHLCAAWVVWMLIPRVLGRYCEWMLADGDLSHADVVRIVEDEWQDLVRSDATCRWIEGVSAELGPLGAGFRLTLWPLWAITLWWRVEQTARPGEQPWW